MKKKKTKLHWQVLLALFLALVVALFIKMMHLQESWLGVSLAHLCSFLGKLFMNALKMVVVPLMVASIITGVMSFKGGDNFGRLALKSVLFFLASTLVAVIVGLVAIMVLKPGYVSLETAQRILGSSVVEGSGMVMNLSKAYSVDELMNIFLQLVPPNIIQASTDEKQLLGLIVFSAFFGVFANKLPENLRVFQKNFWDSIHKVMMLLTDLILRAAPIGIFGLVMPVILRTGLDLLMPMLWFLLTVVSALLLFAGGVMIPLLRYMAKVNPWTHLRAMFPVLLTAFSTASSASTLPLALECLEKDSKVSNRVASFTLPLGITINMAGSAMYECLVVIFIGQIYGTLTGIYLTWVDHVLVVIMALLTSFGVAAVPAASLVSITLILGAVGLPLEAVGVVWVTDRILDMFRTAVNVFTNTCGVILVARSEGEETAYPLKR